MTKQQRQLATARLLCDELKSNISKLENQLNSKGKFDFTASGRAETNRIRLLINKLIIESTKTKY